MAAADNNFPLLDYLDDLVEDVRTLTPKALDGEDPDAVHDARVGSRRLKAAIDLVEPIVSKEYRQPLAKIHRLIRKRLGPLRDLDVMLEHLSKIKAARFEKCVSWLIERLKKNREKALKKAADDLPAAYVAGRLGSWWGLREEIAKSAEAVTCLLAESVHIQLDSVAEQAGHLTAPGENHEPHQLRIDCKNLRYTLEMAQENGAELQKGLVANFKRLQTALGSWHDYVVLTERALSESTEADLALHDPELQQSMLKLATNLMGRAQKELAKVNEFWRTEGETLVASIRAAFVLTKPVEESPVVGNEQARSGTKEDEEKTHAA
jgi:CHAD domain-containing protein